MQLGIVTTYDNIFGRGEITAAAGTKLSFKYENGQSMQSADGLIMPQFTGKHIQPEGYQLKQPDVGDPVAFTVVGMGVIGTWGYVRHFIELVERQSGTRFAG